MFCWSYFNSYGDVDDLRWAFHGDVNDSFHWDWNAYDFFNWYGNFDADFSFNDFRWLRNWHACNALHGNGNSHWALNDLRWLRNGNVAHALDWDGLWNWHLHLTHKLLNI